MVLPTIEIYNGISCILFVIVSITIGTKIVLKYFKYKYRPFIFAGLSWTFMSEPWWAPAISFITLLTTGKALSLESFFIISVGFVPLALLFWLAAFMEMVYKKGQKKVLIIFTIEGIIYEIFAIYFILTAPSVIIVRQGLIDATFQSFVIAYLVSVMIIILITGLIFAGKSLKSEKKDIRIKGKFLAIGFISFVIGAFLDGVLVLDLVTTLIYLGILISSAFEFYFGLFLPDWMKKLFKTN